VEGRTIVKAQWRALDREGEDRCRLAQLENGWLLIGHARFKDSYGHAALDYVVRCDAEWHTLGADVAGTHGGRELRVSLEREGSIWALNGQAQPQVRGAVDVDLAFTPATNLMPIRRLYAADKLHSRAAWLTYPACELKPLDQTYTSVTSEIVTYAALQTGYVTQLCVDPSGFATLYPGVWEGEVRHAA